MRLTSVSFLAPLSISRIRSSKFDRCIHTCPKRRCYSSPGRQPWMLATSPEQRPATSKGSGWHPSGLLQSLVAEKEFEVQKLEDAIRGRPDHPLNMRLTYYSQRTPLRLGRSLRRGDGSLAVVAVIKTQETDILRGEVRELVKGRTPAALARDLEEAGADAIFFHVDERYGVSGQDLERVAKMRKEGKRREKGQKETGQVKEEKQGIPLIYYDLIVHPLQIAQAAEMGADAVVIVAAAALYDMSDLLNTATMMGLEVVVECFTELERDYALECGATLLYLTNRDRGTARIVQGNAEKLKEGMPEWCVTIGGGGIESARETWTFLDAGFDAVVVGETLLRTRRPAEYIMEIRSEKKDMNLEFFRGFGYGGPPEMGPEEELEK